MCFEIQNDQNWRNNSHLMNTFSLGITCIKFESHDLKKQYMDKDEELQISSCIYSKRRL